MKQIKGDMTAQGPTPEEILRREERLMNRACKLIRANTISARDHKNGLHFVTTVVYRTCLESTPGGRLNEIRAVIYANDKQLTSSVVATDWERI